MDAQSVRDCFSRTKGLQAEQYQFTCDTSVRLLEDCHFYRTKLSRDQTLPQLKHLNPPGTLPSRSHRNPGLLSPSMWGSWATVLLGQSSWVDLSLRHIVPYREPESSVVTNHGQMQEPNTCVNDSNPVQLNKAKDSHDWELRALQESSTQPLHIAIVDIVEIVSSLLG